MRPFAFRVAQRQVLLRVFDIALGAIIAFFVSIRYAIAAACRNAGTPDAVADIVILNRTAVCRTAIAAGRIAIVTSLVFVQKLIAAFVWLRFVYFGARTAGFAAFIAFFNGFAISGASVIADGIAVVTNFAGFDDAITAFSFPNYRFGGSAARSRNTT